jgi:hypothetical protein
MPRNLFKAFINFNSNHQNKIVKDAIQPRPDNKGVEQQHIINKEPTGHLNAFSHGRAKHFKLNGVGNDENEARTGVSREFGA